MPWKISLGFMHVEIVFGFGALMLRSEHVNMSVSLWTQACE